MKDLMDYDYSNDKIPPPFHEKYYLGKEPFYSLDVADIAYQVKALDIGQGFEVKGDNCRYMYIHKYEDITYEVEENGEIITKVERIRRLQLVKES